MATNRICFVPDCGKAVHYNGMCSAHAEKNRLYGDPVADMRKSRPNCQIDGCDQPNKGHGYCSRHLRRYRLYGDPMGKAIRPKKPKPPKLRASNGEAERFYREAVLSHRGDECLIWPFAKRSGYGVLANKTVSRIACEEVNGPPPSPFHEAAHSCGNGAGGCVSPGHLSWKTSKENIADQIAHGTRLRGERRWNAKLTDDDVRQIRMMIGYQPAKQIAAIFGVDASVISHIKRRKCWGWLVQ